MSVSMAMLFRGSCLAYARCWEARFLCLSWRGLIGLEHFHLMDRPSLNRCCHIDVVASRGLKCQGGCPVSVARPSATMASFLWNPGFVVADHGVEGDEQFAGDGDDGDLFRLAGGK